MNEGTFMPEPQLLYDDHLISLKFCPKLKCLEFSWKGLHPAEKYKDCLYLLGKYLIETEAQCLTMNLENRGAITEEEKIWLINSFATVWAESELKMVNIVVPKSELAAKNLAQIVNDTVSSLAMEVVINVFKTYEEVRDYMKNLFGQLVT